MSFHSLIMAAGLITATFLAVANPLTGMVNQVEAYKLFTPNETCVYPSSTINWKSISLTAAHLTDVRITNAFWNDIGANFYLKETTGSTYQIGYDSVSRSDVDWYGIGAPPASCSNGIYQGAGGVTINSFKTGSNRDLIQGTAAHETGHALGLDHTQTPFQGGSGKELMYDLIQADVVAPNLDDIAGVQAKYGIRTSTSQCNEQPNPNPNGDVIYTGTCSNTNPALSMTEFISTATSSSKASAFTSTGAVAPPSQGYVMTAKVKANTVNKFIMGSFTSTDVSNTLNRFMTIEMSSDGFYLMRSTPTGYTRTTISSTAPTVGQVYFLEIVVRNGLPSKAYVFKDNGAPTNPPDMVGNNVVTASTGFGWTTPVYHGTGVWTTSSTQPKPSYTISQYYNLLRSYN